MRKYITKGYNKEMPEFDYYITRQSFDKINEVVI